MDIQTLAGHAQNLATALGSDWALSPLDGGNPVIRREDGLSLLVFEQGFNSGRLEVSVSLEGPEFRHAYQYLYPRFDNPHTTFDPARLYTSPRVVARQVDRKVVTPGLAEVARLKASMDRTDAHDAATTATIEMLGLEQRAKPGRPGEMDGTASVRIGEVWGSAQVSGTNVTLDLHSLTAEQARDVLDLLRLKHKVNL